MDIRSPADGQVVGLAVQTVGGATNGTVKTIGGALNGTIQTIGGLFGRR